MVGLTSNQQSVLIALMIVLICVLLWYLLRFRRTELRSAVLKLRPKEEKYLAELPECRLELGQVCEGQVLKSAVASSKAFSSREALDGLKEILALNNSLTFKKHRPCSRKEKYIQ